MSDKMLEFARRALWVLGIAVAGAWFGIFIDWWWAQ